MKIYFPKEFRDDDTLEFNLELIKKLKIEIDSILDKDDEKDGGIYSCEKNMLKMSLPNMWNINVKDNIEVRMEVNFEKFLFAISEHTNESLNDITVFRFYSLLDFIKEKSENNK